MSLILREQGNETLLEASEGFDKLIWTDKETYELSETIKAAIVFINKVDQPHEVYPTYSLQSAGIVTLYGKTLKYLP